MASTMHLFLVVFVITGSSLNHVNADYEKYVSLIFDVHTEYKTSSVFFIFSRNNPLIEQSTMAHSLSYSLTKEGIYTRITHFDDWDERYNYCQRQIGRPFVVISLKSLDDIDEFNESVRERNKSFPIWLVIFHGHSSSPFCEYCRRPMENMFGLRFDTSMFVFCCDDSTLQKWWSDDGNHTEIRNFGIWTTNERSKLVSDKELDARRRDFHVTGLRVVIVTGSVLLEDHGDDIGGFFRILLNELQLAMNFKTTTMLRVKTFGDYNSTTRSWSGAMGVLARGEADLALADFGIKQERLRVIDFTYPLYSSRTFMWIRTPDGRDIHWLAYFQALTLGIWVILIVLVITTPLVLALIEIQSGSNRLGASYVNKFLSVWGIYCQQGLSEFPTETPMKIAYVSIFGCALVVYVAYSASLISSLTVPPTLPFSDLIGFVNDGSYKVIAIQQSTEYKVLETATDPILKRVAKLMKPWKDLPLDAKEAFDQTCTERVAVFATDMTNRIMNDKCNVVGIDTGRVFAYAMGLPVGSQYTEIVNYYLQLFEENGVFKRLRAMFFNKINSIDTTFNVVEFSGVAPTILIFAAGVVVALIVLVFEVRYYPRYNGRRESIEMPSVVSIKKTEEETDIHRATNPEDEILAFEDGLEIFH